MGTLSDAAAITRIATVLQDPSNIRWPADELRLWISDAQREIAAYKPDALVRTAVHPLVAGSRQTLPADGFLLVDVVRNMGTGGATPGSAPRLVSREILDAQLPGWHTTAPAAEVQHFVFDAANPQVFYVYPPQPATNQGSLELVYAAAPGEVAPGGNLDLGDTWLPAIVNYVLHRAYSKDAEYAGNAERAALYLQAFVGQMTGRSGAESALDPNRGAALINPNVRRTGRAKPMAGGAA